MNKLPELRVKEGNYNVIELLEHITIIIDKMIEGEKEEPKLDMLEDLAYQIDEMGELFKILNDKAWINFQILESGIDNIMQ